MVVMVWFPFFSADWAKARAVLLAFEFPFLFAASFPSAGERKANACLSDDFHQARTIPGAVLGKASFEVLRGPEIMPGVLVRAGEVQEINGHG
jgi:hypothetical protein